MLFGFFGVVEKVSIWLCRSFVCVFVIGLIFDGWVGIYGDWSKVF